MEEEMERELAAVKQAVSELARAMQAGFQTVEQRFDKIDKRFDRVESGLSEIKGVTRRTAVQVSQLVGDVADIKHHMATKMATKNDVALIHSQLEDHDKPLLRLEARRLP